MGGNSVDSQTEIIAGEPSSKWQRRVFTVGYLAICTVAMICWLVALGWAAIGFVQQVNF
jgi:hypothetical protein